MNQSYFLLVFVLPTVFEENKKVRQAAECYAEIHAGHFQYSCLDKEWTLTGKCYKKICMQLITAITMHGQLLWLVLPLFLSMSKQIVADFS